MFGKGSTLVEDISEAVLKVTQNGEIDILQGKMLDSFSDCSQLTQVSIFPGRLGPGPFTGMFMLTGGISEFVFFSTLVRLVSKNEDWILNLTHSNLITRRVGKWWTLLLQIRVVNRNHGVELIPNQAAA